MARMGAYDELRSEPRVILQVLMGAKHLIGLADEDLLHLRMEMRFGLFD